MHSQSDLALPTLAIHDDLSLSMWGGQKLEPVDGHSQLSAEASAMALSRPFEFPWLGQTQGGNFAVSPFGSVGSGSKSLSWNFSDPISTVANATPGPQEDTPLLIPLPPAARIGLYGLAAVALLILPPWLRRKILA